MAYIHILFAFIEDVEIFDLNTHSVIKQITDIFEVLEMMSKIRK